MAVAKKSLYRSSTRKLLSRSFAAVMLAVFLFTRSPAFLQQPQMTVLGLAGLLFIWLAAFGRLWASIFIAGRKNKELVDQGPYSVTRNPLYLFSLMGVVGLGLASCNPIILVALPAAFIIYYPGVISQEEEKLLSKHGELFRDYQSRVPRILPRLSKFEQPDSLPVQPGPVGSAFADAIWFLLGYIILRAAVWVHASQVLPALQIPLG